VSEVQSLSGTEAHYEYGPFGELVKDSRIMTANPFRFSTKYTDQETGLLYYGYRSYEPTGGRWLSKDPIGELGFNLRGRNFQRSRMVIELLFVCEE